MCPSTLILRSPSLRTFPYRQSPVTFLLPPLIMSRSPSPHAFDPKQNPGQERADSPTPINLDDLTPLAPLPSPPAASSPSPSELREYLSYRLDLCQRLRSLTALRSSFLHKFLTSRERLMALQDIRRVSACSKIPPTPFEEAPYTRKEFAAAAEHMVKQDEDWVSLQNDILDLTNTFEEDDWRLRKDEMDVRGNRRVVKGFCGEVDITGMEEALEKRYKEEEKTWREQGDLWGVEEKEGRLTKLDDDRLEIAEKLRRERAMERGEVAGTGEKKRGEKVDGDADEHNGYSDYEGDEEEHENEKPRIEADALDYGVHAREDDRNMEEKEVLEAAKEKALETIEKNVEKIVLEAEKESHKADGHEDSIKREKLDVGEDEEETKGDASRKHEEKVGENSADLDHGLENGIRLTDEIPKESLDSGRNPANELSGNVEQVPQQNHASIFGRDDWPSREEMLPVTPGVDEKAGAVKAVQNASADISAPAPGSAVESLQKERSEDGKTPTGSPVGK